MADASDRNPPQHRGRAVTVRAALPRDAAAIASFAGELYASHHAWDPARFMDLGGRSEGRERFFRSQVDADGTFLLVAEHQGATVGYAYATLEARNYPSLLDACAWLHDVYVRPEARGIGAGRALFEVVRARAKAAGAPRLLLQVAEANAEARRFFARLGARVTMREMTLELDGPESSAPRG